MKLEARKIDARDGAFLQKLNSLDFGPVAYKLMHPDDRTGLSFDQAIDAIKKYKGFLYLYYANPGRSVCPSRYIDYVWHNHILDTELYSVQTAILFGNYLHHFPFFGKRSEADEQELIAASSFTREQAQHYFDWDDDDWCGTAQKPWTKAGAGLSELANTMLPGGIESAAKNQDANTITIEAGNFRHTIEHIGLKDGTSSTLRSQRLIRLERWLKLPPWVTICKPVHISIFDDVVVYHHERLLEVSDMLVKDRLTPENFSADLVDLQVGE